ncbi:S66 peptidase family protein [Phenylobacterium zucineum]|uniref:S66 peptidase family protein n=1 Tax=Phenylobacterium zucineum TaxID=284016 RepID=UPI00031F20E1|nr:LD-carboxypeptidase [Phenylobacterium zucineum]
MDRRAFLMAAAAAGLATPSQATPSLARPRGRLVKPTVLRSGDRVALVNPSTAVHDPAAVQRAEAVIKGLGLIPVVAHDFLARPRDLRGSMRHRLDELHGAFADPSIKGVFCARGGYGVSEIVAHVDYDLIDRHPKVFLGFSDLTLLQLAIQRRTGLVTFHGRMPALGRFPAYSLEALHRAVCSAAPLGELRNPGEANPLRPTYPLRTISSGVAEGSLVGGNLAMILAGMGTPWEIDTRGAIFFFEDVDESPYSIARMLLTLKHAGKFKGITGVVAGACARSDGASEVTPYGLNEVFDHVLGDLGVPVFSGLAIGHTDEQLTLPLGVRAQVDAGACKLTVLEAGVVA